MPATQAVLFDLDGTLLDTAPDFTHCLNVMLQEKGLPRITLEGLRQVVSSGALGMLSYGFKLPADAPQMMALNERFLELYDQHLGQFTQPFPGIESLIENLQDRAIPWAIVTNKPQRFAQPLIQQYPRLAQTHCLVAGDSLPSQKPDPAPMLHACAQLGVDPKHCWYIGDAKADVVASQNAGMRCAIVRYGYIPADTDPLLWHADYYLSQAADISPLVQSAQII